MASPAASSVTDSASLKSQLKSADEQKKSGALHHNTRSEDLEKRQELGVGGVGRTQRQLKNRHVSMIGFGSGIGTGLFIGTGAALASAGPLGLLLAFMITGFMLWCVMQSIGEMATLIPTAGTFPMFATRFISPSVGFSLAISYFYCYAVSVASELSAAAVLVSFWTDASPAITITVGLVLTIGLNFLGVRWYGESEVLFSMIKIGLFVLLIIVSVVITLGGAPEGGRIGFQYWKRPGPFQEFPGVGGGDLARFLAFFSAFINAAYTFIGIEGVAIAAGEASQPSIQIPRAIRRVVWRILFFYVAGVLLVGMIISSNDPALLNDTGNANSSPFVIAIRRASIPVLPSFVNACILTSAWSAGNSYLYIASRTLLGMALDRQAPEIFTRVDKRGVPIYAVGFTSLFSLLAFLSLGSGGAGEAFQWLLNLSTIAGLVAWGTLSYAFIRFHKACKVQGVDRREFHFTGVLQPYIAWFGVVSCVIVILFSGWSVFLKGNFNASDFMASYIGIPIFVVPIIGYHYTVKSSVFHRPEDIDLWSGRLSVEDEVPEPIPTTKIGRAIDWLL